MKCIANINVFHSPEVKAYIELQGIRYTKEYNATFNYGSEDYTMDTEDALALKLRFPNLIILSEKCSEIYISGRKTRIPYTNRYLKSKV